VIVFLEVIVYLKSNKGWRGRSLCRVFECNHFVLGGVVKGESRSVWCSGVICGVVLLQVSERDAVGVNRVEGLGACSYSVGVCDFWHDIFLELEILAGLVRRDGFISHSNKEMSRNYFQHSTNYKTLTGLRGGTSEQRFDTSLLPSVTDTYDIGSGTLKWQEVFANKVEAIGGESRFSEVDVTGTMRTEDLIVTGNTTYNLLSANDANIANLDTTDVIVRNDLTVLGQLNYTLPPAAFATFGTLSDVVMGDLVTDPLDATPPEAANSNLQPESERVLSAPTINATQWISTPFLTLMGLAQTDKLKVTSDKIPASKTDFNNTAFWNEGGAILQGKTYIDAECIPQTLTVIGNASVGGNASIGGSTTLTGGVSNAFTVTGDAGLPAQNNTGNAFYVGGQGGGNSGRVIIGDGTGWEYRFANRVSSTTNDVVKIRDNGSMETGVPPSDGSPYGSVNESMMRVQSTQPHTTTNHSGTLMLLDNSPTADNVNTGKGGSVVFAGPYADAGSNFYGAAGRIRGITANGAYGGALTFETADTGGSMNRRATIDLSGQVGIGTTTPGRLLDVAGVARCTQMEVTKEGSNLTILPRQRFATVTDGWVTLDPDGGDNQLTGTGIAIWASSDVLGIFRSLREGAPSSSTASGPNQFTGGIAVANQSYMRGVVFEEPLTSTSFAITPGVKGVSGTSGWATIDPSGTSGNTGTYFRGAADIEEIMTVAGGVRSTMTGNATSTTVGPNVFSGGLSVNGNSFFTNVNCTGTVQAASLTLTNGVELKSVATTEGLWSLNSSTASYVGLTGSTIGIIYVPDVVVERIGTGPFTDTTPTAAAILADFSSFIQNTSGYESVEYTVTLHNRTSNVWTINLGAGVTGHAPIRVSPTLAVRVSVCLRVDIGVVCLSTSGSASFGSDTVSAGAFTATGTLTGNLFTGGSYRGPLGSSVAQAKGFLYNRVLRSNNSAGNITWNAEACLPGSVFYRGGTGGNVTDTCPNLFDIVNAMAVEFAGYTLVDGTTWEFILINNRGTGAITINMGSGFTKHPISAVPILNGRAIKCAITITNNDLSSADFIIISTL